MVKDGRIFVSFRIVTENKVLVDTAALNEVTCCKRLCIFQRLNECQIYMVENKGCRRNSRAKKQNSCKSNCKDFFAHTNPMLSHALVEIDAETWHAYSTPVLWNICMFKNKLEVEVAAQRSRTAAKAITRCLVEHKSNVFACIYWVTCWKMTCIFSRPVLWKIWMLERRLEGEVAAQTSRTAAKAVTRTFAHKSKVFASNYWGRCWKMACIFSRTVLWKISMFEKRIEFEITAQRSRTIAKRSRKFSPVLDHRANPK